MFVIIPVEVIVMNEHDYLKRFNMMLKNEVTLNYLAQMQEQHLEFIPFENLDVLRKEPIYLNLEIIYQKVVTNTRGGFCYELNGLFQWLLTKLGFEAALIAATVLKKGNKWAKDDTHAAIIVQLDQPYLVDVGFGAATPRIPIPLSGEAVNDVHGIYRIQQLDDKFFDLILKNKSGERILYRVQKDNKELSYFHEGIVYNQVSKESTFTHYDIVTRSTKNGQLTLNDQTLTVLEDGIKTTKELTSQEKNALLLELFTISI